MLTFGDTVFKNNYFEYKNRTNIPVDRNLFPESGMGYQLVKVFLTDGKVLRKRKVLNSSILVLDEKENISSSEIEKIELELSEE